MTPTSTPMLKSPEIHSEPLSQRMREAVEWFTRAGMAAEEPGVVTREAVQAARLEEALGFANRRLRRNLAEIDRMQAIMLSTLQSLTVGVLAVGQDSVVIVANPAACRLLECQLEALAGKTIDTVLPAEPAFQDLLLTLQGSSGGKRLVVWQPEPVGTRQIEFLAVRALPPYDDHLAGLVLLEDVTELRRLEQQAQLRSRLTGMGEIAMNLAHEIRNPLGSIALFASALARDLDDDAALAPIAQQIVAGVSALEHLVVNTLEFARPRRMAMTRVSLCDVLKDTLVYVQHPLAQKNISVTFDHDLAPEAWIAGDSEQLRQVFLNLIINAIQAMFDDGNLEISIAAREGDGWEVVVSDDGVGIPEELLSRIFDPFFTTREKGSGIGLAIVHNILSAHGAQIDVTSRVAVGTVVRARFSESYGREA